MKYVYFIKPIGMDGPVKIGCSYMPENRLKVLMSWSPLHLEVVAKVPGDYSLERNIQDCFAHLHSHLEWFHAGPDLTEAMQKLAAGAPLEQVIDLSKRRGNIRSSTGGEWTKERRLLISYYSRLTHAMDRLDTIETYCVEPPEIRAIMDRWSGRPYRYGEKVEKRSPTAEEFEQLEAFLADPEPRCERRRRAVRRVA